MKLPCSPRSIIRGSIPVKDDKIAQIASSSRANLTMRLRLILNTRHVPSGLATSAAVCNSSSLSTNSHHQQHDFSSLLRSDRRLLDIARWIATCKSLSRDLAPVTQHGFVRRTLELDARINHRHGTSEHIVPATRFLQIVARPDSSSKTVHDRPIIRRRAVTRPI